MHPLPLVSLSHGRDGWAMPSERSTARPGSVCDVGGAFGDLRMGSFASSRAFSRAREVCAQLGVGSSLGARSSYFYDAKKHEEKVKEQMAFCYVIGKLEVQMRCLPKQTTFYQPHQLEVMWEKFRVSLDECLQCPWILFL
ncbi:hypothetical protein GUJ93_ZPchr0006g45359 [Zizania palustris]|uniref:Uncharacterized protein n=1 Tax=Zizania palustris TaxID=103762 RepID=A0A8J5W4D4_ZIZPA|nr:hypothetical protein GUJ93_ZPchr0006g45359 [Zizania palustris]